MRDLISIVRLNSQSKLDFQATLEMLYARNNPCIESSPMQQPAIVQEPIFVEVDYAIGQEQKGRLVERS